MSDRSSVGSRRRSDKTNSRRTGLNIFVTRLYIPDADHQSFRPVAHCRANMSYLIICNSQLLRVFVFCHSPPGILSTFRLPYSSSWFYNLAILGLDCADEILEKFDPLSRGLESQ